MHQTEVAIDNIIAIVTRIHCLIYYKDTLFNLIRAFKLQVNRMIMVLRL